METIKVVVIHQGGVNEKVKTVLGKELHSDYVKIVHFSDIGNELSNAKLEAQYVILMPEIISKAGNIIQTWPYKTYFLGWDDKRKKQFKLELLAK